MRMTARAPQIVIITGVSGAGRSTIINALEDLGFEAIDNLPLSLLPRLLDGGPPGRPLALGIDSRTRDFSAAELVTAFEGLANDPAINADLVFVDCDNETLQRRYSETRRRHPLTPEADPEEGIRLDRELVGPLRDAASVVINTTNLSPHEARAETERHFVSEGGRNLNVQLCSFSYKRGLPPGADLVFDCRFLRNPHWEAELRPQDGRSKAVQAFVEEDPRFEAFLTKVLDLMDLLLPAYKDEGKNYLTIAFGCTGGKHRSVTLAEITASRLAQTGWQVSKRHRELGQMTEATPSEGGK